MCRFSARGWLAVGVIAAGSIMVFLPWPAFLLGFVEWIRLEGWRGILAYCVVYAVATILLLPGSVLTCGAGFAYGVLGGTLAASPASMLGAIGAFLIGRHLARGPVARKIQGDARFTRIDRAVGRSGFKVVLLLRLSPAVPFNVLNYALGLSAVRFRDYALASFVGMLPGTVLYVYLGSLATSAAELAVGRRSDAGWGGHALYWSGMAATVAVSVVIARLARSALKEALDPAEPTPAAGSGEAAHA